MENKTMALLRLLAVSAGLVMSLATAADGLDKETVSQAKTLISRSLDSSVGYDIINSLTTEVGPRLAGSEAEARARDWAVAKFKTLGFKNVRIEPFSVDYWERHVESAEIVSPFPQQLHITTLGGSVATKPGGVTGQIARFASLQALIDAPMVGLAGKIVFVDEYMTRTQDGSGYGVAVRKRSGAANEAGKRGAIAALIRSVGTDQHRFPHTGQMNYAKQIPKVPIAALSAPDADQLQRALLLGEVEVKLSLEVESLGRRLSGNVIGEIPGKTDEIVIIGGHLDSWDLGTGAVDDGAGIGITLGAAKMILDLKRKPQRTIRVVMFGSEEVGLVGAKAYAEAHKAELDKHVIGAESDFGGGKIWRFDTRFDEDKLHFAAAIQAVLGPLGIAPGDNSASGGPDMGPMRALGMPVATLKQNGWDYFDLHHTANDTFDKIKPEDIAQNVAAYAAFAWMTANLDGHFRASPE
ncbi:MAG: carboxypeptidase Q [Porticoccaceae bacterium]|jgi:carboxypeptidase Q|tara:strand:+ start:7400 stop:8800 length:1401 start_codon:yes stop_codon:yes gene_type:complete